MKTQLLDKLIPPDAVFFDWDGTLVDTYEFLSAAHSYVLVQLGFPPFTEGEYKKYFGKPRDILYKEIYKEKHEEAREHFQKYVTENAHQVHMLDGARDLLDVLKLENIPMGVVSNKLGSLVIREIEKFGLDGYFKVVVGGGEASSDKPSGAPLLLALERAGIDPKTRNVWYVGDTENDLACAKEAGCHAVFIEGHEDAQMLLAQYNPLLHFKNCHGLKEILVALSL